MSSDLNRPVLFFDGVCNLCSGVVQFFIRNDKKGQFLFASLQSKAGEKALREAQQRLGTRPDSVLLYTNGQYFIKSNAVITALSMLGGGWSLSKAALILPGFFRNAIYDWVARNRYKWFGRQDACMIPSPELKARFLSD